MDELHDVCRRLDAFPRLFLEHVQPVHGAGAFHRVHSPERAPVIVRNDFENSSSAEALEWFGIDVFAAVLGLPQGKADYFPHFLREVPEIVQTAANPKERFEGLRAGFAGTHYAICSIDRCIGQAQAERGYGTLVWP